MSHLYVSDIWAITRLDAIYSISIREFKMEKMYANFMIHHSAPQPISLSISLMSPVNNTAIGVYSVYDV